MKYHKNSIVFTYDGTKPLNEDQADGMVREYRSYMMRPECTRRNVILDNSAPGAEDLPEYQAFFGSENGGQ